MGGAILNRSSRAIWIFADNRQLELQPNMDSRDLSLVDADGFLLDGSPVFFNSSRKDLGGGGTFSVGAFKVCDLGTMTVTDSQDAGSRLTVEISAGGYLCPSDSAGYKPVDWCESFDGWLLWPKEKRG